MEYKQNTYRTPLGRSILVALTICALLAGSAIRLAAKGVEEINTYYVRLDIKSSHHKITTSKLTMVPAEKDYRREDFSPVSITLRLPAAFGSSRQEIENTAKRNALMQILEQSGLKSVTALNQDTIISYEGMILTPISLKLTPRSSGPNAYDCLASVYFASMAFPDQWESLKHQFKIKKILNDFILFFK